MCHTRPKISAINGTICLKNEHVYDVFPRRCVHGRQCLLGYHLNDQSLFRKKSWEITRAEKNLLKIEAEFLCRNLFTKWINCCMCDVQAQLATPRVQRAASSTQIRLFICCNLKKKTTQLFRDSLCVVR